MEGLEGWASAVGERLEEGGPVRAVPPGQEQLLKRGEGTGCQRLGQQGHGVVRDGAVGQRRKEFQHLRGFEGGWGLGLGGWGFGGFEPREQEMAGGE